MNDLTISGGCMHVRLVAMADYAVANPPYEVFTSAAAGGDRAKRAVRVRAILSSNFKLICPVQPGAKK